MTNEATFKVCEGAEGKSSLRSQRVPVGFRCDHRVACQLILNANYDHICFSRQKDQNTAMIYSRRWMLRLHLSPFCDLKHQTQTFIIHLLKSASPQSNSRFTFASEAEIKVTRHCYLPLSCAGTRTISGVPWAWPIYPSVPIKIKTMTDGPSEMNNSPRSKRRPSEGRPGTNTNSARAGPFVKTVTGVRSGSVRDGWGSVRRMNNFCDRLEITTLNHTTKKWNEISLISHQWY